MEKANANFASIPYSHYEVAPGTVLNKPLGRCSNCEVVLCSDTTKSGTNGSSPLRCTCLKNRVKSEIFRTRQKSCQVC